MKKYIKPEIKVVNILLNDNITQSISGMFGGESIFGSNATENVTFNDWIDLF